MAETWNKKERERKKQQKKKEKEERRLERKNNVRDGNNLENMMAYLDENGNLSSTPSISGKKSKTKNAEPNDHKHLAKSEDSVRQGTVKFFDQSKGYGFIEEDRTQKSFFVHINSLMHQIKKEDKVIFEIEMTHKGASAVKVKLED
jgi:cold shock CspA family protein